MQWINGTVNVTLLQVEKQDLEGNGIDDKMMDSN